MNTFLIIVAFGVISLLGVYLQYVSFKSDEKWDCKFKELAKTLRNKSSISYFSIPDSDTRYFHLGFSVLYARFVLEDYKELSEKCLSTSDNESKKICSEFMEMLFSAKYMVRYIVPSLANLVISVGMVVMVIFVVTNTEGFWNSVLMILFGIWSVFFVHIVLNLKIFLHAIFLAISTLIIVWQLSNGDSISQWSVMAWALETLTMFDGVKALSALLFVFNLAYTLYSTVDAFSAIESLSES